MIQAVLSRRDYLSLALLGATFLGLGVAVEIRSAFLKSRHTDLGPPLRAAWALRNGVNPHTVTDNGGLHYVYPLPFALLMAPFADAPPGHPQPEWAIPYPVSVAVWYLVSLVVLFWAVHHLCRALDETAPGGAAASSPHSRRFWWLRTAPVWVCLAEIGSSLSRGQVNLLLVALITGFIAATLRGRRAAAGWWLAAATCLKVIPALLVLDPLLRRDWRTLGHYAMGLVAGLVLFPVASIGPERTWEASRSYAAWVLFPGLTNDPGPLAHELTSVSSSDNQSVRTVIHNVTHWAANPRPPKAAFGATLAHGLVGLALIAWTFLAARRIPDERYRTVFRLGGLATLIVAISPMSHTHYMVLAIPVVTALVYRELEQRGEFRWGAGLSAVVALHLLSGIYPRIPQLPGYQAARDLGVTMLGTLLVWWAGLSFPARGAASTPAPRRAFAWLRIGRGVK
jgi:hypothetical protein